MTAPLHRPVLLVPAESPLRARALALLDEAKVPVRPAPSSEVEVAVVDVTGPNGADEVRRLLEQAPRIGVLVVADPSTPVDPRVLEVLAPAALESELVPRLNRLQTRLATLNEAQQRQRDLKVLLDVTARYAEATNVDDLLYDVTRRLADELDIDRVALVAVDDSSHGIIIAASDDAAVTDLRIDLARYPEIREAIRTQKPVIVEDAPSHPLLEGVKDSVAARGLRNIAAMPLQVRNKVLGVLLLRRSSARGAFNPREVEFLTTVAQASAIAFRNVRQLESERGRREVEKLARIAAEERAAALKRYAAYFEHLSDGVAILDAKATVLSLNPAGLALLDAAAADVVGRHINAVTNPTDEGLLVDVLYSVAQGKVRADVDLQARTSGGRRLVLSVSAAPLYGDADAGTAILTLRDVTRQRQMAEDLRKTSDFLERLIDSSVDAIIAADVRGEIILFNKAAEVVSGWQSSEVLNKVNVSKLYPPGLAREVMIKLRSTEHGGVGRLTTTRAEILTKGGARVPVNMTASILYEGSREVATVGIFTDLRDRLNLERKLTDTEAKLLESEKNTVIVALAGTAAHELNQPLTSVMGYAELLKRKISDRDPSYRSVDIIHREAERMAEIVRKIGKITRYETKSYVGSTKIVDLDKASAHEE